MTELKLLRDVGLVRADMHVCVLEWYLRPYLVRTIVDDDMCWFVLPQYRYVRGELVAAGSFGEVTLIPEGPFSGYAIHRACHKDPVVRAGNAQYPIPCYFPMTWWVPNYRRLNEDDVTVLKWLVANVRSAEGATANFWQRLIAKGQ